MAHGSSNCDFNSTHRAKMRHLAGLEPGQRAADQDRDTGRAGGERTEDLIGHGPPADTAVERRADQVDASSGDP